MKEPKVHVRRDPNTLRGDNVPIVSVDLGYTLTPQASFAKECIEKWGLIAATDNGEDSVGRAKLRLMGPEEVVERACTCADLAYKEFEHRGWFIETPSPEEAEQILQERENARENGS